MPSCGLALLTHHAPSMSKPLMRIPLPGPLPPALIVPRSAATTSGAIAALTQFLTAAGPTKHGDPKHQTVLLTGAGISVASGLADYRGENGTYTLNKSFRPIYFHEFVASHEARKRYWARSFLGWRGLKRSQPNAAHIAVGELGRKGLISSVITQNVDSFHPHAHPDLPVVELHGFLRSLVCLSCQQLIPREEFQADLARLNPAWASFLRELIESGALDTENPHERRRRGFKTNPDGDADVPGAPYTIFRYPACPTCLTRPPILKDGTKGRVETDADGALSEKSDSGILKPNVIMFGESIPQEVKAAAEHAIDEAGRVLVIGSSLATYSAWRLVKKAFDQHMPIGILNLGGVRKEEEFFPDHEHVVSGESTVRASLPAEVILPQVVQQIS